MTQSDQSGVTQVGVCILVDQGAVLVGTRGANQTLPGCAEFPGGKVLPGESHSDAAVRECFEETGLVVRAVRLLESLTHHYPHGAVDLQFWLCELVERATPKSPFVWRNFRDLSSLPFPAANESVIAALSKPDFANIGTVCVFCGSQTGRDDAYQAETKALARLLVERGTRIVYGGGNIGLMGVLADEAIKFGGKVIGVIPEFLESRELLHGGLSEVHIVQSMHQRKLLMADRADAFLALPGGLGTFDELFEILTWRQLHLHDKPIGILNIQEYFNPVLAMIEQTISAGFCSPSIRELFLVDTNPKRLLDKLSLRTGQLVRQ